MNLTSRLFYSLFQNRLKPKYILTACLGLLITANVVLDYLFTRVQNSAFYFSESLLFSSYWALFLPLLTLALKRAEKPEKAASRVLIAGSAIVLHLLLYPALVWMLSKVFCAHTFNYMQTFHFGLSAYFIKTVLIYGFLLTIYPFPVRNHQPAPMPEKAGTETGLPQFIHSILIADGNNRKLVLAVADILYFSANPPYVNIHHSKKHLHTGTLRSLETQLNGHQFVRIHKSYIVNVHKIASMQSRQNGDYDITLLDDTVLRVSRNYAKHFKLRFSERHQLTIK
ncbi:LytTR family transcriptional regulator [Niabella pedocola]|uniref:LytTR family transcriptional regulator n=1 Tax=Niabella pedocola TaxID=1752077 RepID=A0ABS8PL34_9BACT|nr:LytTR family DNA-binding domain-containing protein [Niabella pedocola]MCD2421711.1 LytTR family transcriptional regulator [Niabella pedocola]